MAEAALNALLERRVLFVGGKGGVGKTTVAAIFGLLAAERGQRCLLVSTDPAHSLGDVFDRPIGERETTLADGLSGIEIDPDVEAAKYVATVKQNARSLVAPALYAEVDRQMELARQAPGAAEAALLERVARLMIETRERYDLLIFDTAPTGHTVRLLSLPELMAAWTDGLLRHRERSDHLGKVLERFRGRTAPSDELGYFESSSGSSGEDAPMTRVQSLLLERRRRFHRARRLMLDPTHTAFVMVLTPEKLPILETAKALKLLRAFDLEVRTLVVNRVLPEAAEGPFLDARRQQEQRHLREIATRFADLDHLRLPLLASDVHGLSDLRRLAGEVHVRPA